MRYFILLCCVILELTNLYSQVYTVQGKVTGKVHCGGEGIAGVSVTDGEQIVETDGSALR
jgi:hypothetical protein